MSNTTLREALEALVRIHCDNEPDAFSLNDLRDALSKAKAALAADDAARGTMREQFEAWAKEYGRIFLNRKPQPLGLACGEMYKHQFTQEAWVGFQAGWNASRAAVPQSVEPPQTTEHTVRDANQKEHMDKIEQSMLTQAIEGRERIWTCKLGGKISGLPKGADGPMRRAAQECFARMTGYEAEFCFSGWGGELTESERAVVENRLPQHPTAPTDAEWLFIAMDDDKRAHLTFCTDEAAVCEAVKNAMFFVPSGEELSHGHTDELNSSIEELFEVGSLAFEGDPPLFLYRLPAPPTKTKETGA